MQKLSTFLLTVLLTASIFAQSPEKMSFQAVIRDNSNALIINTNIGMQISILQGSISGTAVYVETQTPTTNANGLVNVEIGTGTVVSGVFSDIDWANGLYFIKTEIAIEEPLTTYTIIGTSQLLSVPYALHAQTAQTVTGGITETDPALAANFDFTDAANGDLLQFNGTKWVKVTPTFISDYTVTESDVTTHQEALEITESQITDLQEYATSTELSTGLDGKVDKEPGKSLQAEGTQAGDMQYWNGTAWVNLAATENEGATLKMIGGVPKWVGGTTPPSDVINPVTGKIWMDRNLGASQVATSSVDIDAYGDLYQWGRSSDGHEKQNSPTTGILSSSDSPDHDNFITTDSNPYDWRIPQNENLWQGVNGINNPCPSGYRLPTYSEWLEERASWSSNNAAGAFASPLKLPMAGYRNYSDGSLNDAGYFGYYWSSTGSIASRNLFFGSDIADEDLERRAYGYSVRCTKD